MRSFACLLVLAGAAAAAAADPLQSPECRDAVKALDAQAQREREPPDARGEHRASATLLALRKRAAKACLGGRGDPPPPEQVAVPPVTVPPVTVAPVRPVPAAPPPPPAVPPPRPLVSITSCDSGGCWASDGSRLNRVGGVLLGPQGACTATAGVVRCP